MKGMISKLTRLLFEDKNATLKFCCLARNGKSGYIQSNGKTFYVEPLKSYIKRLVENKNKRA